MFYFTFERGRKQKQFLILSLKCCERDDLGEGARFHLVKTSYINKMGLEIQDKIDLCGRFELWPHSLPWWTTLVIGKWDRHFRAPLALHKVKLVLNTYFVDAE